MRRNRRPPYPAHENIPVQGCLPPAPIRSYDFLPSHANPAYDQYSGARRRHLAGLSGVDMQNAEPVKDYANELDILQQADDVVGNGIFDPHGSHSNVHPDQGVFADHQSLPGYVDREQFYMPSEVEDATTDAQVMYVPGGAVGIDEAQKQAYQNRLLWSLPPGINPLAMQEAPYTEQVVPNEASWAVGQTAADQTSTSNLTKYFVITAVAGLSIGMFLALVTGKKRAA